MVAAKLSCGLEVILLLLRLKTKMGDEEYEKLKQYISPSIDNDSETGWEESTLASLLHLLQHSLGEKNSMLQAT